MITFGKNNYLIQINKKSEVKKENDYVLWSEFDTKKNQWLKFVLKKNSYHILNVQTGFKNNVLCQYILDNN